MMVCALTIAPRESVINCKVMELFDYFPFPLQLLKHHVSEDVRFLLFFINHILVVSVIYLIIVWGYRYFKKNQVTS